MGDKSNIEWTDASWNPVTGCTKVSPGCAHCYAEAVTLRFKRGPAFLPGVSEIKLHPDRLDQPLRWQRPRRVFVNSMSDLFHEDIPFSYIDRVFAAMALGSQHTFQVLTKRPDRMADYMGRTDLWAVRREQSVGATALTVAAGRGEDITEPNWDLFWGWPLPNVWLGVSVENQYWADRRIPALMQTPAAVRFLSVEPLLKPVSFRWASWTKTKVRDTNGGLTGSPSEWHLDGLRGIHWVIVGGESGPRARPMKAEWVQHLRDECREAGVAFFFKQWGGQRPRGEALLDGREWHEYPDMARQGVLV